MSNNQKIINLLRPVIIIISIFFSLILTLLSLNLLKISLSITNSVSYILRMFDSSIDNPLTYIKWGLITLVLYCIGLLVLFMGNYVENYYDRDRIVYRTRRVNHHHHY